MFGGIDEMMPKQIKLALNQLAFDIRNGLEEIRIREERPLEIVYRGQYGFITTLGKVSLNPQDAIHPTRDDCAKLLDVLTNHSVYSFEEELRRGYITIAGGHRVGLAGRTVLEQGRVKYIRNISGFNIRIAREVLDCGKQVLPALLDLESQTIHHTLVISSPQKGKTTLIRDLARLISYGYWGGRTNIRGLKVAVVDERSELAACVQGVPAFDLGPRTDVLDGCPKAEGMMMMIRAMSPDVIVVDEIGREEDATAIREAVHAGIRILASAHASDLSDIRQRPVMKMLIESEVFSRYILMRNEGGTPSVQAIYDQQGNQLRW
ncbi:MAG: stage III sporulation protein AA [Paenibacillaceae bacterium]